ncbi:thermonuclease family protein [Bradyrhizobium cosmicum]|uniref:thermonuclease family protein n=1 Tax=Bradyrhizobium cosmicum TaxID=1404864 RepID=UPI0028E23B7F|nr:thermonuclease family protein [Bradyrhizobium cosmicum]
MTVIPFRRRRTFSGWPVAGALATALFSFAAVSAFLVWSGAPHRTEPDQRSSQMIEVIDGDTVRLDGNTYRLVGFNTPEKGDLARCEDERKRADVATKRLKALIATGDARLSRLACACKPGQEGTKLCNFGRLCGMLSVGGRDVAQIMISEGLAERYVCSATRCPPRKSWCG